MSCWLWRVIGHIVVRVGLLDAGPGSSCGVDGSGDELDGVVVVTTVAPEVFRMMGADRMRESVFWKSGGDD